MKRAEILLDTWRYLDRVNRFSLPVEMISKGRDAEAKAAYIYLRRASRILFNKSKKDIDHMMSEVMLFGFSVAKIDENGIKCVPRSLSGLIDTSKPLC